MRIGISTVILLGILAGCGGSKSLVKARDTKVLAQIDLVNTDQDRVLVTIDPGAFIEEDISFYIPKTVPGTYSSDDYGQYIESFKALDYDGQEMVVNKPDINSWSVSDARNLDKISYYVNDTFDEENNKADVVFSPAGTNINAGENFVLNLHGFVGYFTGLKEIPYEIQIRVPEGLVSTTSLHQNSTDGTGDIETFTANRYFEVIDNPILYAAPNSTTFQINDIQVTLAVYSPNGVYRAEDFKDRMESMMRAQKAFLGNVDSTEEYNILLYLSTMDDDATGFGALEHHTSTVVVFPEQMPKESLEDIMVDVVSHEFFHIVTPLNVHSNEIHYFDYNDPKMSEHLWMYEGTTEYFANLFQIQQGLISEDEFYGRISGKISSSLHYNDAMSFTVMSKNILNAPYEKNYANVYEKGALINMCLDIILRDLSGGEKGVLWLMKELSVKYDANTPFNDSELIPEIVAMTYPEIGEFFETHIQGDSPIDYYGILSRAGVSMSEVQEESSYFFKGEIPYIDLDQSDNSIFVRKGIELNSFFTGLGLQGGDTFLSIDGIPINLESMRPILGESFGWTPDREISVVVLRDEEKVEFKGRVGEPKISVKKLTRAENTSESQNQLREAWLKG